ncbi:MAG: cell division protein SepF [Acidimicrobiales bacterium]
MRDKTRKFLGFLGLIEDEYGDYASGVPTRPFAEPEYDREPEWTPAPAPAPRPYAAPAPPRPTPPRTSSISVLDNAGQVPRVRPMPSPRPATSAVPQQMDREPAIFEPISFNESSRVTDLLRDGRAVVLNVSHLEPAAARRTVDFSAGSAHALWAKIDRLAPGVYLIIPRGTYVSAEARDRLHLSNFRSFDVS